jgi:hypothetical protein
MRFSEQAFFLLVEDVMSIHEEYKKVIPPLSTGMAYTGHRNDDHVWYIRIFPHVEPGYYFIEVASSLSMSAEYSKSALNGDYLYLFLSQTDAPCAEYEWESFSKAATSENPFLPPDEKKLKQRQIVYFIQGRKLGLIKIGIAWSARERMKSLQTGSPDELILLATESGGSERERELHNLFSSSRSHGEWFYPTEELMRYIEDL